MEKTVMSDELNGLLWILSKLGDGAPSPEEIEQMDENVRNIYVTKYIDILSYKIQVGMFFYMTDKEALKEVAPDLYRQCEVMFAKHNTAKGNAKPEWFKELQKQVSKWGNV